MVATLHLLSLLSIACTSITNIKTDYNTSTSFTNELGILRETLVCPSANLTGCLLPRKTYNITIPHLLTSRSGNPLALAPRTLTPCRQNCLAVPKPLIKSLKIWILIFYILVL
jgi:archaellum component FlaF (FlaF/FlaG flagellin family)